MIVDASTKKDAGCIWSMCSTHDGLVLLLRSGKVTILDARTWERYAPDVLLPNGVYDFYSEIFVLPSRQRDLDDVYEQLGQLSETHELFHLRNLLDIVVSYLVRI